MKKFFSISLIVFLLFLSSTVSFSAVSIEEKKKEIIFLYNSNKLEDAYKMISTITEQDRDYELWFLLANLSQDFNDDTNAIFFLQKSIMLKPDFDKAHYNLANIYFKQKKHNTAVKEYNLAIKYNKNFAYYYYNLGCTFLELNELKKAKNSFEKAIKLKNDDARFYYNLALVNKKMYNDKEAQKALDLYNQLNGKEEN